MLPNRPPLPPGDVLLAGGGPIGGGGRPVSAATGRAPSPVITNNVANSAASTAAGGRIGITTPSTNLPPSAGEVASNLLVRRRILFATLLLPIIYLLTPPTLVLSYLLLGRVSGDHPFLSFLGGMALTVYVRDGVVRYAPTKENRDDALARCRVRLPLLASLVVGLVFRWMLDPLLGRLLPRSSADGSGHGGGVDERWNHQIALLTWAFSVGWYLCLTGLALSASVYLRFVGPVAIVRCSSVPLFTNPYEATACSAWSKVQSVFSSFDAFCDFLSDITRGEKTNELDFDARGGGSGSLSSSSSSIYRDDRRGNPPVLARPPPNRPRTSVAAESDVVNPYVDSRRRSAAVPHPHPRSLAYRLSGSGRYKRPTLVRSVAQISAHALCGAMFGAFLVSFFSEVLFGGRGDGSSWSSAPVVTVGGEGTSAEWWWPLLIAVIVSGSLACLSVMVHILFSGDAGGADWVTDPRRRPFTTELDVEMYPHLNDEDSTILAGSSSQFFPPPSFRALAGGEMIRCVRSTLTWTVCTVLLASPILVARIGHAGSAGAASYSLLNVTSLLRGLWTWAWMVLSMASTAALAICHLSLTDVLARICLSQPVRLHVLARETRWSSSLPPSSVCSSGEVLLDVVLGSPDLVRMVCTPTMSLAGVGIAGGHGGSPANFEGDEGRRNIVASTSVADHLVALIPSASGSLLQNDLGGALVLEALGGGAGGRDNGLSAVGDFFGLPRHVAEVERRVRSRLAVPIVRALSARAGGVGEALLRTVEDNEDRRRCTPVVGQQLWLEDDGLFLPPGATAQLEWSIRAAARMVLAGLKRGGRHCPIALLIPSVMNSAYRLRMGCVRYATSRVERGLERGATLAVTKQQQHQLAVGNASRIMRASGGARNRFWIKNEMEHLGEPVMVFSPEIFPVIAACDEAAFLINELMSAIDDRFQSRLDPTCRQWVHHLTTQK